MGAAADTDNRSTHETELENREKTEDEGEILTRQELHLQEARTDVATAGQTENDGAPWVWERPSAWIPPSGPEKQELACFYWLMHEAEKLQEVLSHG